MKGGSIMPTYWDDFIEKNKDELPYWSLQKTLEKFYDYLESKGGV